MPSKIQIVDGAYSILVISGLTTQPTSEEVALGMQALDDLMAELKPTLDTGYIQPLNYGQSNPNDFTGLTNEMAGPVKKMLAREILANFGKPLTAEINSIYQDGLRRLEQLIVEVSPAQNPATLPIGSGNEWDYRSDKFYNEPNNDDGADTYYKDESFDIPIDWSSWLAGQFSLISVQYEKSRGINITNEALSGTLSTARVSFNSTGQFELCVKATNSVGDIKVEKFTYNSINCKRNGRYYY